MDFSTILSASFSHIANDKPVMDAARGAFDATKHDRSTLVELFVAMAKEEKTREALDAAGMTTAAKMAAILKANGVDMTDDTAMRAALWPHAAEAEGFVYVKGESKKDRSPAAAKMYQNAAARVSRAVARILGKDPVSRKAAKEAGLDAAPESNPVKVRVPSAVLEVVTARKAAGKSKAEARAELLAALDRAYA